MSDSVAETRNFGRGNGLLYGPPRMTQVDEEPSEKSIDSLAVTDAVAVIQNRTEKEPDDL